MTARDVLNAMMAGGMALMVVWAGQAGAGNREMVERRIDELDRLNQRVVRQLPDLPRDGTVSVNARVLPDGTLPGPVRIRAQPSFGSPVAEDAEMVRLVDALRDAGAGQRPIRGYRDANTDRGYIPLKEGLGR
jgi:hypothetical protein